MAEFDSQCQTKVVSTHRHLSPLTTHAKFILSFSQVGQDKQQIENNIDDIEPKSAKNKKRRHSLKFDDGDLHLYSSKLSEEEKEGEETAAIV